MDDYYDDRHHDRGGGPPPRDYPDDRRGPPPGPPPPNNQGMATAPTDTSLFSKKFRDGWKKAFASKQDLWKVAVLNATGRDTSALDQQIVSNILEGINNGGDEIENRQSSVGAIVHHLEKRLREPDWIAAFKSQSVFHYVFRQTHNYGFVTAISRSKRSMVDASNFSDLNPSAAANVKTVKTYGAYLTELCFMKAEIDFPPTRFENSRPEDEGKLHLKYRQDRLGDVLRDFPFIMQALEALLQIDLKVLPMTQAARNQLGRDFALFWKCAQECAETITDLFFTIDPRQQKTECTGAKNMFTRFVSEYPRILGDARQRMSGIPEIELPRMGEPPFDLLDDMEAYVRDGPSRMLGTVGNYGGSLGPVGIGQAGGRGPGGGPVLDSAFFLLDDFSEGATQSSADDAAFNPFAAEAQAEETAKKTSETKEERKARRRREKEEAAALEKLKEQAALPYAGGEAGAARGTSEYEKFSDPSFDPFTQPSAQQASKSAIGSNAAAAYQTQIVQQQQQQVALKRRQLAQQQLALRQRQQQAQVALIRRQQEVALVKQRQLKALQQQQQQQHSQQKQVQAGQISQQLAVTQRQAAAQQQTAAQGQTTAPQALAQRQAAVQQQAVLRQQAAQQQAAARQQQVAQQQAAARQQQVTQQQVAARQQQASQQQLSAQQQMIRAQQEQQRQALLLQQQQAQQRYAR
ncbi:hypothetical protein NDN08_003908 [Rhodosorus marinus]|uniref:ENTH domain-containing protein n=1 Tax=Rhodosorus marinus TaxID=101924 RepID=A0AAV8UKI3_9RHOD|nr:hypothetical protein NDN08_003908 [Rhodosorus marinus]